MRGTYVLPDGSTVRSESTQRYLLIGWQGDHWKVIGRRNKRDSALAAWRSEMRAQTEADVAPHLLDSHTGTVLR